MTGRRTARGTAQETTRKGRNDQTHDREHDRLLEHERNLPATSARQDDKGDGDDETRDEQGKRRGERENEYEISILLYGFRGNVLDWKICIYRVFPYPYLRLRCHRDIFKMIEQPYESESEARGTWA